LIEGRGAADRALKKEDKNMSLTLEAFLDACDRWRQMEERINRLLGFNPATSDHYGRIHLYNENIYLNTTDERILEIRKQYLEWKKGIFDIFREEGYTPEGEFFEKRFEEQFRVDYMYGTVFFIEKMIDIHGDVEEFRPRIVACIKSWKDEDRFRRFV